MQKRVMALVLIMAGLMNKGAQATEWYSGQNTPPKDDNWIVAVDSSVSITSKESVFGTVAATVAPIGDLRHSGMRARLEGLVGTYSYEATKPASKEIRSQQQSGSVLGGYEWVSRDTTAAIYAGVMLQNISLSSPDPHNSTEGAGIGAKIAADFYTRPTPDMMVAGYASYATLNNSYYSRLKVGWAVFGDDMFLGPEVGALGDDFYSQYRVGVHLSGIKLGALSFGVAGGFLQDKVQGSGAYGTVDARFGF